MINISWWKFLYSQNLHSLAPHLRCWDKTTFPGVQHLRQAYRLSSWPRIPGLASRQFLKTPGCEHFALVPIITRRSSFLALWKEACKSKKQICPLSFNERKTESFVCRRGIRATSASSTASSQSSQVTSNLTLILIMSNVHMMVMLMVMMVLLVMMMMVSLMMIVSMWRRGIFPRQLTFCPHRNYFRTVQLYSTYCR